MSEQEARELEILLKMQSDFTRFLTQEEFDRIRELRERKFKNIGSPHQI